MSPIISYKNIVVDGPASRAAATNIDHVFALGADSATVNGSIQTGSKIMSVLIFASFQNLVAIALTLHLNVGIIRGASTFPTPGAVGGTINRNQVFFTHQAMIGKEQNNNFVFRLKIPKIYQRVREGDQLILRYRGDAVFSSVTQVIYKSYR